MAEQAVDKKVVVNWRKLTCGGPLINGTKDYSICEETGEVLKCVCTSQSANFNAEAHFALAQGVKVRKLYLTRNEKLWLNTLGLNTILTLTV